MSSDAAILSRILVAAFCLIRTCQRRLRVGRPYIIEILWVTFFDVFSIVQLLAPFRLDKGGSWCDNCRFIEDGFVMCAGVSSN